MANVECNGMMNGGAPSGTLTITARGSSGITVTDSGTPPCSLNFDVSGSTATAAAGQSCNIQGMSMGYTITGTATVMTDTITTKDGKTATEDSTVAVVNMVSGHAGSVNCTQTLHAMLTKN